MKRRWVRVTLLGALVAGSLVTVAVAGYLFYLDRTITGTFEGRRWTVPAVVYAQPLELYPGAPLSLADVTRELGRLGYEADANPASPGAYKRTADTLQIHLRAFRFMDGERASQLIELGFDRGAIRRVQDRSGRPVPLVRLDPLMIGSFFPSHGEDRMVLTPDQVPNLLRQSLKAVEDHNFDHHVGFDPVGIARALWVDLKSGHYSQGGSTLTQQLVKSYFLDNSRTLERKLRELAMSVILEARFGKADILNAYINEIYLGQDGQRAVHGFGLGSEYYFNRPLSELGVDEIATLIAVIRGPSYYNPFRHPDRALARRDLVLEKMHDARLIRDDVYQRSVHMPLKVVRGTRAGGAYHPAFMDLVRKELAERYQEEDLTTQGLRVFTTLAPNVQDAADQALSTTLDRLEQGRGLAADSLQGAVVVTANQTGEVLAVAGGRRAGFDGFNRAMNARRPIGSLVKPVVYLTALEHGYHLASVVQDTPVSLTRGGHTWQPSNFDHEAHGPVPLIRGLGDSMNLATVNLGLSLGVETVAARFGELTGTPPRNHYPSLLLGAEAMSPLEVTALYGTFASGGFHMQPKSVIAVLNESGSPISRYPLDLEQRIDSAHARILGEALETVMRHGTGAHSRFARAGTAGKTGTTNDYRDSWFAGYDDVHLGVVWVGADDNTPTGLTGSSGAMQVWDEIMTHLGIHPLRDPPSRDLTTIDYQTGLLAREGCAETVAVTLPEDVALRGKPGCGINSQSFGKRLRSWFGNH